jgi:ribose-phosphate pyrophosphokinase
MSKIEVLVGGRPIAMKYSKFPGGEEYVRIDDNKQVIISYSIHIIAYLYDSAGVMRLLMVVDALRRMGSGPICLELPYVPYGRQDRVCSEGESFSIKVFCDLINSMKLHGVWITDPHSDVTPALLDNCTVQKASLILGFHATTRMSLDARNNLVLVSPDAGANKKVLEVAKAMNVKEVVRADKVRDVATGKITDTVVYSEHIGDKDFFIVDDVGDGLKTYVELGKKLKPLTNGKVMLYVTHLIAGYGTSVLDGIIDELYYHHCFDEAKLDSKIVKHIEI